MKNRDALVEKFAQCLSQGMSQVDSYRAAFPISRKWKPNSVYVKASLLCGTDKVQKRIAALQQIAANRVILKLEDLFEETKRVALSTPTGIIDVTNPEKPRIKLPHELDAATAAAISSFKIDDMGRIEYKFWDKNSSLERMAKILGAFEKDNRQKNPLTDLLDSLSGNVTAPGTSAADDSEDEVAT